MTALVSTKSPISSIVTVHLDGRQDWLISQRQALLAWTGHTLSLKPQYNVKLGLAHWGNTYITGRGLLALAGSGQIYQVQLKAGESYVAHPRYVDPTDRLSPHLTPQQQCRSIHGLVNAPSAIPLQIVESPLPGPRPRLRLASPERQVLQSHEPDDNMADPGNSLLHAQDLDAAFHLGRPGMFTHSRLTTCPLTTCSCSSDSRAQQPCSSSRAARASAMF